MRLFTLLFFIVGLFLVVPSRAQQDPLFSKYKFNTLVFNPAYAGSHEHLSLNTMYRHQWLGFDGAPRSYSLIGHTPLRRDHVALGASLLADKTGANSRIDFNTVYAYRIPVGDDMKLSLGLQAGLTNWHSDWFEVTVEQGSDEVFQNNQTLWLPNFGAGAYLYGDRFFAGFSCPRLVEHDLRRSDLDNLDVIGREYRHFYLAAGGAIPIGEGNLVFRPSGMLRNVGFLSGLRRNEQLRKIGSPNSLDLDAAFILNKMIWGGLGFRTAVELRASSADAFDVWFAWQLQNGLRFGASYDIMVSSLRSNTNGSFELMLGYEFDIKVRKASSVRYF
jgi:type IX secretion system PorP/SprF family membrane protein